jgi:hypothetical protein
MDIGLANKIIDLVFKETGLAAIVCDDEGCIVAAHVASRIGNTHSGAQRMLRERLPGIKVSRQEEEASGGMIRMGMNLPIVHEGQWIGSFGISGDPELMEPVARIVAAVIASDLAEAARTAELLARHDARLLEQSRQLERSIGTISGTMAGFNDGQGQLAAAMGEVQSLLADSARSVEDTRQVVRTIQDIADQTSMLGLNAAIEAAHAREHGAGFAIVANAVRELSEQCANSAEEVRRTLTHLQAAMTKVVAHSERSSGITREQVTSSRAISGMVRELAKIGEELVAMTQHA